MVIIGYNIGDTKNQLTSPKRYFKQMTRITRKFIAEKAGVSETTVSYVVNRKPSARVSEEVRNKVLRIARQYHYMPDMSARALVTGRTFNIGLLYKSSFVDFISDPFTHEVFVGLENEIEKQGYCLMLALLERDRHHGMNGTARRIVGGRYVDGVILCGDVDPDLAETLSRAEIPFVLADYRFDHLTCNWVMPDNVGGARQATQYLIDSGCRQIVCLNGELEEFIHPAYSERPSGYRATMTDAGLTPRIIPVRPDLTGAAASIAERFADEPLPEAFFATGDQIALACLRFLREKHPEQVGKTRIIGFDDIAWAATENPPLSTVRVPKQELGAETVRLLLQQINAAGQNLPPRQIRLGTELVIRTT